MFKSSPDLRKGATGIGVYAVIMAGGSGERFWPLSRTDRPKQFLNFFGEATLLQEAVRRARLITPPGNVFIVTGRAHFALVRQQVPGVPQGNVICEPVGRDTAPCIAIAAARIRAVDPDGVMVVLPSDHFIRDDDGFTGTIRAAIQTAKDTGGLVTIGIRPTRPETGYGYIQLSEAAGEAAREPAAGAGGGASAAAHPIRVERFVEKPLLERAREYLASGRYLWNSGMFVWTVGAIRGAIEECIPEIAAGIRPVEEAIGGGDGDVEAAMASCFPSLRKVSIDYGVMERATNVWVVPASFEWDDVGSWTALERVLSLDDAGNQVTGNALPVSTTNSIIGSHATGRLVATFGLDGAVVVDTPDAVLVTTKDRAADLKELLAEMQARGLGRYQSSSPEGAGKVALSDVCDALSGCCRFVEKPWGREIWWSVTGQFAGKILQVKAGHSLSLQYHRKKHETMLFVEGEARMEIDGRQLDVKPPRIVDLPPGVVHRVTAVTNVTFLEVSTADLDDIVRLEDSYGRP
ncbi:MAG: NTP transferase domain-containing protein [Firmicutes bacterium]|nr:NTP transferase domain-containing protein [Bacillota bacterium]